MISICEFSTSKVAYLPRILFLHNFIGLPHSVIAITSNIRSPDMNEERRQLFGALVTQTVPQCERCVRYNPTDAGQASERYPAQMVNPTPNSAFCFHHQHFKSGFHQVSTFRSCLIASGSADSFHESSPYLNIKLAHWLGK